MTDVLDRPALPQGGSGTAPPKGKARPKADAAEAPAVPEFRAGDRVWFWTEGGDGPTGLDCRAADVVEPAAGFPGFYAVLVLTPFGHQAVPFAEAVAEPKALCITKRD